ncbi:FAD/NAD(P)-binding protein [Bremerella alba]|uniref:FAD-dependent urate hydroxylase HpyO/Asp monooxygenase CreE-like FAD/NAD(P)-binding domain-containing protein n=1 Tax=Bremerella alba TaxID=980252 RepID=A0A7V9A651_9BACT|nr:FAD/NAD(P)-binding domain-containing protein [Bremerella alba]MBA2113586.1 hypothetical protein [Bremerella alba]
MTQIHTQLSDRMENLRPSKESPYRIAIIGGGPRGLYCLESLSRALSHHSTDCPVAVDVFDPCSHPGAGNVYALDQPDYLRMNFPNGRIDAWGSENSRQIDQMSLLDWLQEHFPHLSNPEGYSPRPVVGRYLHECFRQVLEQFPSDVAVQVHQARVTEVIESGPAWKVSTTETSMLADNLVLTTGHEGWRSTGTLSNQHDARIIEHVFPVGRQLSQARIPAQSTVAIRGFGLTWIDATLALTEGRGGTFSETADHWTYQRSGDEPTKIFPYSRTGRPLLAKSVEPQMKLPSCLSDIWESGRLAIAAVPQSDDPSRQVEELWQTITNVSAQALQAIRTTSSSASVRSDLSDWFTWWKSSKFSAAQAYDVMKRSRDVGIGLSQPNEAWIWGETWRRIYPALVARVSHGGLCVAGWKLFREVTIEMERLAFGPPPENMSRMLALIDSGIVDLRFVSEAELTQGLHELDLCSDHHRKEVNVVVNAVIPAPCEISPRGPISSLLDGNAIAWDNREIGLPVDEHGCPPPYQRKNLAIFGRVTEGTVLGNDTLSRKLHPQIENWAQKTAQRVLNREYTL